VQLMAVDRVWHRRGVGRALLRATEADLRKDGVRFLQVSFRISGTLATLACSS
jgi:predicted N-acetyltransferase YhbS